MLIAVGKEIKSLVDTGIFPLSEIAVMYTMKKAGKEGSQSIPELLATALDSCGILNKWLSTGINILRASAFKNRQKRAKRRETEAKSAINELIRDLTVQIRVFKEQLYLNYSKCSKIFEFFYSWPGFLVELVQNFLRGHQGLDFACVFLIGLDAMEPGDRWAQEQIDSLAYVGITRARYRLEVPYIMKNALMERLLLALHSV